MPAAADMASMCRREMLFMNSSLGLLRANYSSREGWRSAGKGSGSARSNPLFFCKIGAVGRGGPGDNLAGRFGAGGRSNPRLCGPVGECCLDQITGSGRCMAMRKAVLILSIMSCALASADARGRHHHGHHSHMYLEALFSADTPYPKAVDAARRDRPRHSYDPLGTLAVPWPGRRNA